MNIIKDVSDAKSWVMKLFKDPIELKKKEASSATARTLSKNKRFSVEFVEKQKIGNKEKFIISILNIKDLKIVRGQIDLICFFERFINKKIFTSEQPGNYKEKKIYNLTHDVRAIILGIKNFPGSKKNIEHFYSKTNFQISDDYAEYSDLFFYLYKFFQKKITKKFKINLKEDLKLNQLIDLLKKNIDDHQNFSKISKKISKLFHSENEESQLDSQNDGSSSEKNKDENLSENNKSLSKEKIKKLQFAKINEIKNQKENNKSFKNQNFEDKISDKVDKYKVFTKKNDLVSNAKDLASSNELNILKKKLDEESPKFDFLIRKLANKLERKLLANQIRTWEFDLEEGLLDSSRLSKIIINPEESLKFKNEKESIAKNTIVTLLIDNSGSMRGRPIIIAANAVEILTKTLERCGVKVEILGFTTREWKGGKSKIEWQENGKPSKPGRLNDLLHIIYKDSSKNWTNCSKNLGLFLKEGLLKENIDGEALEWANKRLSFKEQKRKILIVISDGAPVDDSTLSANNANILETHLSDIVKDIENKKFINLIAIGIGHDVSKYYKKAFTIDDADKLAEIMLEKLTEILSNKKVNS